MGLGESLRDLRHGLGILRGKPFQVLLQVTNRCSMKCDFCAFWSNGAPPREELTLADYQRLEEGLAGLGTFMVSIEGGEPLLRPDLVEIVRTFGRRHLPVLFTNGWAVTPELAGSLFGAGLMQVGVSIDYPDAARHDARRVAKGAFDRAWRAVEALRDAAPHRGRQVHVMTVLMDDNVGELEKLLELSAARRVGHCVTLVSVKGFRRGGGGPMPAPGISGRLLELWERWPHLRIFRDYLAAMDPFLAGSAGLPQCHAGRQSFNVDHLGNVSPCIEKIDRPVGNVRQEPLAVLHARLAEDPTVAGCQDCWTACRGVAQALGGGGTWGGLRDLVGRMRSV